MQKDIKKRMFRNTSTKTIIIFMFLFLAVSPPIVLAENNDEQAAENILDWIEDKSTDMMIDFGKSLIQEMQEYDLGEMTELLNEGADWGSEDVQNLSDNIKDLGPLGDFFKDIGIVTDLLKIGQLALDFTTTYDAHGFATAYTELVKEAFKTLMGYVGGILGKVIGKWIGGWVGGLIGAAIGGIGAAPGAWIGSFLGGFVGSWTGKWAFEKLADWAFDKYLAEYIFESGELMREKWFPTFTQGDAWNESRWAEPPPEQNQTHDPEIPSDLPLPKLDDNPYGIPVFNKDSTGGFESGSGQKWKPKEPITEPR